MCHTLLYAKHQMHPPPLSTTLLSLPTTSHYPHLKRMAVTHACHVTDLVRHQCFVVRVHILILLAMDLYPGDEVLQEASIEALAVLGGAGEQLYSVK